MVIFVLPQLVYLYPILFTLLLPPVALNLLFILWAVPENCKQIPRDTIRWKLHVTIQGILCTPALVLASASILVSRVAILFFGTAYCMFEDDGTARYQRNIKIIEPYCHGPALLLCFSDIVAGVAGMVHRRGLLEFTSSFSLSEYLSSMPFCKMKQQATL